MGSRVDDLEQRPGLDLETILQSAELSVREGRVLVYMGKTNWRIIPSFIFEDSETGEFKGRTENPSKPIQDITIPVYDFKRLNPEVPGGLSEELDIARIEVEDSGFHLVYKAGYLSHSWKRRTFCKLAGASTLAATTQLPWISVGKWIQGGTEHVASIADEWTDAAKYFTKFMKNLVPFTTPQIKAHYDSIDAFFKEEPPLGVVITEDLLDENEKQLGMRAQFLANTQDLRRQFLGNLQEYTGRLTTFEQSKTRYERALTKLGKIISAPIPNSVLRKVNDFNEKFTVFGYLTAKRRLRSQVKLLRGELDKQHKTRTREWADVLTASRAYEAKVGSTDEFYTRVVGLLSQNMNTAIGMIRKEESQETINTERLGNLYGLLKDYMVLFNQCDQVMDKVTQEAKKIGRRYTAAEKAAVQRMAHNYTLFLETVSKQIEPVARKEEQLGIQGLNQVGYFQSKVRDFFSSSLARVLIPAAAAGVGWWLGGVGYTNYKRGQKVSQLVRSVGRKLGMNNPIPEDSYHGPDVVQVDDRMISQLENN